PTGNFGPNPRAYSPLRYSRKATRGRSGPCGRDSGRAPRVPETDRPARAVLWLTSVGTARGSKVLQDGADNVAGHISTQTVEGCGALFKILLSGGGALGESDLEADVDLQSAGAARGLIEHRGESVVIYHGAFQNCVGRPRVAYHFVAASGNELVRDGVGKAVRELVANGYVAKRGNGDHIDALGQCVGLAGDVIAAGAQRDHQNAQ